MKRLFASSLLIAAIAALFVVSTGIAKPDSTSARSALSCKLNFKAGDRIGPSKGLNLAGTLSVNVGANGAVTGALAQKTGPAFKYEGQLTGQAISIALYVPHKGMLFGSGMLAEPLGKGHCGMYLGGTFAGPAAGDLGDWAAAPQNPFETYHPGAFDYDCAPGASRTSTGACIPNYFFPVYPELGG